MKMVHSEVTDVVVKRDDCSTVLTVRVVGFAEGKSVEVYGYLTQLTGAFASFRETHDIGMVDPATDAAELTVTVPAKDLELDAGQPVTVLTWVSESWPSMLTPVDTFDTEKIQAEWAVG